MRGHRLERLWVFRARLGTSPSAPFLKHSHTALMTCNEDWPMLGVWKLTKGMLKPCPAHNRCFKNTHRTVAEGMNCNTLSILCCCCGSLFKQQGKLFCARLQNEGWGSASTDETGCGHVTIITAFRFLGSRHYPGPQPAFPLPTPDRIEVNVINWN